MLKRKIKVGVVGCGGICKATYMDNMVNKFAIIDVVGCYDLIESRMDYMVEHYGIKKYDSLEAIVSDPEIEIIVNLTYPESHFLVSSEAMKHGKHVYCEKMMAPDFEQAKELARLAEENHVMYTTAPDTFLGAHEQSARFYIDNGIIGKPLSAQHPLLRPGAPLFLRPPPLRRRLPLRPGRLLHPSDDQPVRLRQAHHRLRRQSEPTPDLLQPQAPQVRRGL